MSHRGSVDSPEAVCASSLRRTGWEPRRNAKKSTGKWWVDGRLFFTMSSALKYQNELKRQGIYEEIVPANPADTAASAAESFHGPDPEGVSETVIVEDLHEHTALVGLGELTQIKLKGGVKISKFQRAILCSNEAGTQLFVRGGDQQVSLFDFDVDATKEKVNLGRITHLDYKTRKFHLDEEDKALGIYRHRLGEVTGVLPDLVYDTINAKLEFVGGAYYIKWDDYDGAHSAGIAD